MSHEISLEDQLRGLQSLLKKLESKQSIQHARWEHTLTFTPDEKKPGLIDTIDRQKARNRHEMDVLKSKIRNVEEQIARQAEEIRIREERRAWLEPIKEQARESWLNNGGTENGFEASWPEMERRLIMQNTLESLAVQPNMMSDETARKQPGGKSTKRTWHSWDPIKPPSDPKKKKRTN